MSTEQAWEDMRAYNIRLEERVREAERALAEIIAEADELLLWQPGKKGYTAAHKRFYDAIYPYRTEHPALRPEDTSDEFRVTPGQKKTLDRAASDES